VPEVAPASSRKGWSRPWSGRGGKWDGADTHHPRALTPGAGPRGHRGVKPSPLPGMRGNGAPRSFQDVPGPGAGPLGAKASDRTGQGRVGVVTSTSTQLSRLPVGERGEVR
jgi:hypothetical protein